MVKTGGVAIALTSLPAVSEIYDGLLRTAVDLFVQQGDPEFSKLENYLAGFCNLR
jgi:hypothetical protein